MIGHATNHLRFIDILKLSLRVFRTKPLRSFLTILGMSFGISVVQILVSLGYGLQDILIGRLVSTQDSLISMEAVYPYEAETKITTTELTTIAHLPHVSEVSPVAEFPGSLESPNGAGSIIVKIVQPSYFRLSGHNVDTGATFVAGQPAAILSRPALQMLTETADTVGQINFPATKLAVPLKVFYENAQDDGTVEEVLTTAPLFLSGIVNEEQIPYAIIPDSYLHKPPPFYRSMWIKAASIDEVEGLRDELIERGLFVSAKIDLVRQANRVMNIITIVLGVFGVTALIVAAVGMFNTMVVSFLERIEEIGIMKSLGATDRDVRNLFLMESVVMGFLGGTCGVLLGLAGNQIGNLSIAWLASRLGGKPISLFITPTWFVGLVIIVATVIGLLAGFWPARRAASLSPKEALNA